MIAATRVSILLGFVATVRGYGWNPDRSRPVPSSADMDDCCRGPSGCCRDGYRCEPNYRTCVRVGVEPRPGGPSRVLLVPVVTRRHQGISSQGSVVSSAGGTTGDCGGSGRYCWDHDRCCHISQTGAHLPTGAHPTTVCCTRSSSRHCPRIRGCHNPQGVHTSAGAYNAPGHHQPHSVHRGSSGFNWDREQLMMQRHTLVPSSATAGLPSGLGVFVLASLCVHRRQ
ncbi:uncharacterized protein LOC144109497 isoform X1 [Amblyomma americanum]